jgi:hypothetical protein
LQKTSWPIYIEEITSGCVLTPTFLFMPFEKFYSIFLSHSFFHLFHQIFNYNYVPGTILRTEHLLVARLSMNSWA